MKIVLLFIFLMVLSCSNENKNSNTLNKPESQPLKENIIQVSKNYGYNIIQNTDKSFGYDIFKNGTKIIRQVYIPAVSGNQGFKTDVQAKALAELVIKKLENNIMPPTVTIEEIDSINNLK